MLTDFDRYRLLPSHPTGATHNGLSDLHRYISGDIAGDERLATLLPDGSETCELLVACRPEDYSASALAKAVEDCDARVLAITVTTMRDDAGNPVVLLRANTRMPEGISRSLERYGYRVIHAHGEMSDDERAEAMARVNELLHYLEI